MLMDLRRLARVVVVTVVLVIHLGGEVAGANILFRVQNKFAGRKRSLGALKAHDAHRRARILSAVDVPLGGDSLVESTGLYFTKIGLGSPSKDYFVQVDTGSDLLWVNCAGCNSCPKKSDLGMKLTLYDSKSSSTAKRVTCDDDFCSLISTSQASTCQSGFPCQYIVVYGDGSSTSGYFVRDTVKLDQVTGNHQTRSTNGNIVFGCGAKQSGQLGGSQSAVDGIIGFGQSNTSVISQLAAAGKVKRVFAHCLDNVNGGGIFAIGEVVSPKVKTTPMVPNQHQKDKLYVQPDYACKDISRYLENNSARVHKSKGKFGDSWFHTHQGDTVPHSKCNTFKNNQLELFTKHFKYYKPARTHVVE